MSCLVVFRRSQLKRFRCKLCIITTTTFWVHPLPSSSPVSSLSYHSRTPKAGSLCSYPSSETSEDQHCHENFAVLLLHEQPICFCMSNLFIFCCSCKYLYKCPVPGEHGSSHQADQVQWIIAIGWMLPTATCHQWSPRKNSSSFFLFVCQGYDGVVASFMMYYCFWDQSLRIHQ